ncbi:HNH endonuclease family protein [Streptomyces sp. NPDC048156]|uniref:HNH endonuclease family protein n=1 Tax=Streptomyces sp. NPDC048156 TaxID=3365502 RepID=UPI00370FD1A8
MARSCATSKRRRPRQAGCDHRVPLAGAWDSGAEEWTAKDAKEREEYANDLGDGRSLIEVSAKTNRSKADQDRPCGCHFEGDRCEYIADWIAVKVRWQLAVDPSEEAAPAENATRCPNAPVKVTFAP